MKKIDQTIGIIKQGLSCERSRDVHSAFVALEKAASIIHSDETLSQVIFNQLKKDEVLRWAVLLLSANDYGFVDSHDLAPELDPLQIGTWILDNGLPFDPIASFWKAIFLEIAIGQPFCLDSNDFSTIDQDHYRAVCLSDGNAFENVVKIYGGSYSVALEFIRSYLKK